jgi:hypothetical protein
MGNPFEVKLKLDKFTPFYETLFLDSDTLVYSDLRFMWDFFDDNRSFVYVGDCATSGEWYVDISKILENFDISWIPLINSGTFLFRKDKIGCEILNFASKLYKNHEGIEIPFFRGKMLPDEPFFGIAFAKFNQIPVEEKDFGRLGRTLIDAKKIKINVTKGISKFIKDGDLNFVTVVHFVGGFVGMYFYFIEKLRLKFYFFSLDNIFSPIFYGLEFLKRKIRNRR